MKKTFLISQGSIWPLARHLMKRYGPPSVFESLTIYIDRDENQDYLKATLSNSELRWDWFDRSTTEIGTTASDDGRRPYNTTVTSLTNLKAKLVFLAKFFGTKGQISATTVYRFIDPDTNFQFDVRPSTLVGEIVSIEGPLRPTKDHHDLERMRLLEYEIGDYITSDGLDEKIAANRPLSDFIVRSGRDDWRLAPAISDFCNRNGIVNAFKNNPSKRELIQARDNNYSFAEEFFRGITDVELLAEDTHYDGPLDVEGGVSIVIPYFNSQESIGKVLLGIESQSISETIKRQRLEVVIVDDASKHAAVDVIDANRYSFKIRVVRVSSNCGAAHARELGVVHSNGEILVFLDSDVVLSKHYLADHIIRNRIITNGVFVSFKEDVDPDSPSVSDEAIEKGLPLSDYSGESRTKRTYPVDIPNSEMTAEGKVNMLDETFYFKNFHGSRNVGLFSLAGMVVGHNFSIRRSLVERAKPFSRRFKGWGMEDYYTGIQVLLAGAYIIPVLSSSVYHLEHSPRSGSTEQKSQEAQNNLKIIEEVLEEAASSI